MVDHQRAGWARVRVRVRLVVMKIFRRKVAARNLNVSASALRRQWAQVFSSIDCLLTPTTPVVATKFGQQTAELPGGEKPLVVHEWGTFTSVAGEDGAAGMIPHRSG